MFQILQPFIIHIHDHIYYYLTSDIFLYNTIYDYSFFLIQQFITQSMKADHSSYFVTIYR